MSENLCWSIKYYKDSENIKKKKARMLRFLTPQKQCEAKAQLMFYQVRQRAQPR